MLSRLTSTRSGPFIEAEIRTIFQAVFAASLALMQRYDRAESSQTAAVAAPVAEAPTKDEAHAG